MQNILRLYLSATEKILRVIENFKSYWNLVSISLKNPRFLRNIFST